MKRTRKVRVKAMDYCNEIMEAVMMATDEKEGSREKWHKKYGKGSYLCSVTCGIIERAMTLPKRRK